MRVGKGYSDLIDYVLKYASRQHKYRMIETSYLLIKIRAFAVSGSKGIIAFFRTWDSRIIILTAFSLNIAAWYVAYLINRSETTGLTILNYKVDFGITYADSPQFAYVIPVLGLIIIIANSLIAVSLSRFSRYLSLLLLYATLFNGLVLALAAGFVYFLNFRQL